VLLVGLVACDVGEPEREDDSRGIDGPPLQLGRVEVVSGTTVTELVEGGPAPTVAQNGRVELSFDRLLLPHKVNRQAVCLRPLQEVVGSLEECAEPSQAFTEPEYRPVERKVVYRSSFQQTTYRLTVFRAEDIEEQHGLFAFDGAPLLRTYSYDFTVGADEGTAEALPSAATWCPPNGPGLTTTQLFTSCAFEQCHGPGNAGNVAAMGLDLRADGIRQTAIGVTAHQTQEGEQADLGDARPERFGRAMPIIDPSNPGNSYLIYKLFVNPLNQPRDAQGFLEPQLGAEIGRIRASVVVGLPMPAENGLEPRPILLLNGLSGFEAMRAVNDWIAAGAPFSCPAP
jgi:hypothetical protein